MYLPLILFIELPEVDSSFKKGDIFGTIESVKAASELYLPVSGTVVEINEKVVEQPELINNDCFGEGWLVKIKDFKDSSNFIINKLHQNYFEIFPYYLLINLIYTSLIFF